MRKRGGRRSKEEDTTPEIKKREDNSVAKFSEDNLFRTNAEFLEKPRQLAVLGFMIVTLAYVAYSHQSEDIIENQKAATSVVTVVFLGYCLLNVRDGLLVRPHPGVWRIVHGLGVIYLLFLVTLLVLNPKLSASLIKVWFPEVGNTKADTIVTERIKLECSINAETIYGQITSIWFAAHVIGWWGKMCMFRDWGLCFVLSLVFELLEMSLQFIIPQFQECWWDSLLVDFFGANMVGMVMGHLTLKFLNSRTYEWKGYRGLQGGLKRALYQFSPFSWSKYNWAVFSSFPHFLMVLCPALAELTVELNAFFLFTVLDVPQASRFNHTRLCITFLLALPAVSEYYVFITTSNARRLGQNTVLLLAIMCTEVLLWVKFLPPHMRTARPPPEVYIPWLLFLALFSVWCLLFFGTRPEKHQLAKVRKPWLPYIGGTYDLLFVCSFLPLLYLTKQWAY